MSKSRKSRKEPEKRVEENSTQSQFVMERFSKLQDADRSFDIEYWQRQGDAAIFQAAWELVELYHRDQGMGPDELRLQKSIEHFERS